MIRMIRSTVGEIRTVSSTDTRATVLDGPVRNGELAKVVTDHLRLDLNRVEDLFNRIPGRQFSRPQIQTTI